MYNSIIVKRLFLEEERNMARIDIQKATEEFRCKFKSNYYPLERSKNNEVDYSKEKEHRDTEAVRRFVKSEYFEYMKKMK